MSRKCGYCGEVTSDKYHTCEVGKTAFIKSLSPSVVCKEHDISGNSNECIICAVVKLQEENERLREALEFIVKPKTIKEWADTSIYDVAKQTLQEGEDS